MPLFSAKAESSAFSYTSTGDKVTSSSSSTAVATSYEEALILAQQTADEVAQSVAENNALIIDEAISIIGKNIPLTNLTMTAYFDNPEKLRNFTLPSPKVMDPHYYNIITNIDNFTPLQNNGTEFNNIIIAIDNTGQYMFIGGFSKGSNPLRGEGDVSIPYNNISCYDLINETYIALPSSGPDDSYPDGAVSSIIFDDSNTMYISLSNSSSSTLSSLTYPYSSSSWSNIGYNFQNLIDCLVINNGNLYFGGRTSSPSGYIGYCALSDLTINNISPSTSNSITSLCFDMNGTLYACSNVYITDPNNIFINKTPQTSPSSYISISITSFNKPNNTVVPDILTSLAYDSTRSILYVAGDYGGIYSCNVLNEPYVFTNVKEIILYNYIQKDKKPNLIYKDNYLYISSNILDSSNGFTNYILKYNVETKIVNTFGPSVGNLVGIGTGVDTLIYTITSITFDSKNNLYCLMFNLNEGKNLFSFASNKNISNVLIIHNLQITNNDGTLLDLVQYITSNQKRQVNTLQFDDDLQKWTVI